MRHRLVVGSVVLLVVGSVCWGAAPLAGLPSEPGEHMEKLKAMGDNTWLKLPDPKPDPKYGRGTGRAYTNKMPGAPDLRGAFLYGEGPHGKTRTINGVTYYNDDLWFYDINANAWICIHPGTDMANFTMTIDTNGFEAAADGQNIPIAAQVHGYECNSYNPDRKQFMTLLTGSPYSRKLNARRDKWLKDKTMVGRKVGGKHPFFYDVKSGRWERKKTGKAGPRTHFCKALQYIPSTKKTMYYSRQDIFWFYDHAKNAWEMVKANGTKPVGLTKKVGGEGTVCLDTKRNRLYIFNRNQASIPWIYDIESNTFSDPKAANQMYPSTDFAVGVRSLSSTSSSAHYDSVNDVVVMRLVVKKGTGDPRNIKAKTLGLVVYDPVKNAWEKDIKPLPEGMGRGSWNSFYDPGVNAHFYHLCRDGRTNGRMWVYRYRKNGQGGPGPPCVFSIILGRFSPCTVGEPQAAPDMGRCSQTKRQVCRTDQLCQRVFGRGEGG